MTEKTQHKVVKVIETDEYVVFDNFLPPEIYERLQLYSKRCRYRYVNTVNVELAWHISDGFPLRGETFVFHFCDDNENTGQDGRFPSGTDFDIFTAYLMKFAPSVEKFIGKKGDDWFRLSAHSWLYPAGTGLSLHTDDRSYTGAFTFFLNEEWNVHWGGMLYAMDPETNRKHSELRSSLSRGEYHYENWLENKVRNDVCWDIGLAQCIFPKGNRIVFMKNKTLHMVTKVTPDAGDRVRRSFAGFFRMRDDQRDPDLA